MYVGAREVHVRWVYAAFTLITLPIYLSLCLHNIISIGFFSLNEMFGLALGLYSTVIYSRTCST